MPILIRTRILSHMKKIVDGIMGPWAQDANDFIANLEASFMHLSSDDFVAKTKEWHLLLNQAPPSVLADQGYIGLSD
jgi:hypothetical protein